MCVEKKIRTELSVETSMLSQLTCCRRLLLSTKEARRVVMTAPLSVGSSFRSTAEGTLEYGNLKQYS
jgi:hypothetical protein